MKTVNGFYTPTSEQWDDAKCSREARHVARDGMGTPYPWPGYIGSHYGPIRYNGGCVRDDEWFPGENRPLPEVAPGFEIVRVPTWGWRIIEKANREDPTS